MDGSFVGDNLVKDKNDHFDSDVQKSHYQLPIVNNSTNLNNELYENDNFLIKDETKLSLVTISVKIKLNFDKPTYFLGLINIVKALVSNKYYVDVDDINYVKRQNNIIVFQPFSNGKAIFTSHKHKILNLEKYFGYTVFLNDVLGTYIANKYFPDKIYIRVDKKLTLIKIDENTRQIIKNAEDYLLEMDNFVYFDQDNSFIFEIAKMWKDKITFDSKYNGIIVSSKNDHYTSIENWYKQSVIMIENNSLPIWKFSDNNLTYSIDNRLKRFYKALISYRDLIKKTPILSSFIYNVNVENNLDITANFSSISDIDMFKEYLIINTTDNLSIIQTENENKSVIVRYFLLKLNPESEPITFEIDKQFYVVFKGNITCFIDLSEDNLIFELKNKFNKCINDEDLITLDSINNMSLEELLYLIPIKEQDQTYCFKSDTLKRLNNLINPLTTNPLSQEIVNYYMNLRFGLRGYFDVGPLTGLMKNSSYIPEKKVSSKIEVVETYHGNIKYITSSVLINKQYINLFTIMIPKEEIFSEISNTIKSVWNSGKLLTFWSRCLKTISFSPIKRVEELIVASETPDDGLNAIKYLKYLNSQK